MKQTRSKARLHRFVAVMLTLVLFLSMAPAGLTVSAVEQELIPQFVVEDGLAKAGETIKLDVEIQNNPGILNALLTLSFDTGLELMEVQAGEALSTLELTKPAKLTSPCNFLWDALDNADTSNGTVLTLTFTVPEDAITGQVYSVDLSYVPGDIANGDLQPVDFAMIGGSVEVIDYLPGDVNNDGRHNGTDVTMLRRHIAGGYDISIEVRAADVNDDGRINGTDVTLIRRYIAGGYDVELKPSHERCDHTMEATAAQAATCTATGNIAYWYCTKCETYFDDASGSKEIERADTVLAATGHTAVIDPAVEPTYTSTGLTEGSHCSVCNTTLTAQQEIPMLEREEYSITYHIANNDTYLAQQTIDNSANPATYTADESIALTDLIVPGYTFEGWYDGAGTNGTLIKEIKQGESGNKVLYAHWQKVQYTVTFDSPLVPVDSVTRTIDQTTALSDLNWDGYLFMGWSDDTGKIVKTVDPGTQDITLHANWTSQRNQTRPNNYLEKGPIIIDDSDAGKYYFVYDIGSIINVPLYTLKTYPNTTAGITITETYTKSGSVSSTEAKTVNATVSNATTKSASWTLSKDWNELVTETEDHTSTTSEEYSVAISDGSSTAHADSGSASKGKSKETASKEGTTSKTISKESASVDAEVSGEVNTGLYKTSVKMGASASYEDTDEDSESSESSKAKSSTWNSEKSYSDSNTTSHNQTVSNAIAEGVSDAWGYSISKSTGGSDSSTEATSSSESASQGYSSAFSYNSVTAEETTETWTNENAAVGYYRLVCAGTVHVFAVVGYDIATHSYFVYTYSVLDDETTEFTDYSKNDPNFEDYNNGVLPFEVPVSVNEYISDALNYTDGLIVDRSTGKITDYEGTAKNVYIPDYMTLDNGDGTFTVVKINGIESGVFAGNKSITSVKLGKYITEIPDGAFAGCTSMKTVIYSQLTSIGVNAFAGCDSLEKFTVDTTVTTLGNGAFVDVPEVVVNAVNTAVVDAAAASGAGTLTLNLGALAEPLKDKALVFDTTNCLTINGNGETYSNVSIESAATTTVINRMTFTDNTAVPLKLESEIVTLNQVTVENAPGLALMLTADNTAVSLQGINMLSTAGDSAVLCKSISMSRVAGVAETTKLAVNGGDVLVYGTMENDKYLTLTDGEIKYLTKEEYTNMLNSHSVYFDANGGNVEMAYKTVLWNSAIGELPVPTRENCTFDGWFTEEGTQVMADTVFTDLGDITLKAHWTSGWVLAEELPEDGEIVDQKWSYDLTTNITSDRSSVEGYALYNTTSEWSDYGSWSSWSTSKATDSDSRQVETKTIPATYKTQYNYSRWRSSGGWTGPWEGYWNGYWCGTYQEYGWVDASGRLTHFDTQSSGGTQFYLYNTANNAWYNETTRQVVVTAAYTQYRYRDRYLIYTYYHTKTEAMESATEISATDTISNVQKWVQYTVK